MINLIQPALQDHTMNYVEVLDNYLHRTIESINR